MRKRKKSRSWGRQSCRQAGFQSRLSPRKSKKIPPRPQTAACPATHVPRSHVTHSRFPILLWLLTAIATAAIAQDRTQLLDVVVTDPAGRAVSSLTATDFTISLDGRSQEITDCSYVTSRRELNPSPAISLRPSPTEARRMVLVADDLNLSIEGAAQLRQILRHYADEQMQPGDETAVVRTSAGSGTQQRFTSDPTSFRALVDRIQSRPVRDATEESLFTVGTIGILQLVLDGLQAVPGRKSVILFTEARSASSPAVLESLIEKANHAFVVFYAINIRTEATTFKEIVSPALAPVEIHQSPRPASVLMANPPSESPGAVLDALAKATGGMLLDRGDLAREFARVLDDQQGYYLIRYHRDFAIFQPVTGAQLVEHVTAKVARDGLSVRARDGFPPPSDWIADQPTTTSERLLQAIRSPTSAGDIPLSLDALFFHSAKDGPFLKLLFHMDGRGITFLKTLDGLFTYGIDAGIMTIGEGGVAVHAHTELGRKPMTEDQHNDAIRRDLVYEVTLPIERPGPYQLRVAFSDRMSQRVGAANQFVYVPDVATGRLTLSGVALEGVHPGRPFTATYEIYNLTSAPDNHSEVELRILITRDSKEIITPRPVVMHFEPSNDPKHRAVSTTVVPTSTLEPGNYTLQLTVTDKLANGPPRIATAQIPFDVPLP